MNSFQEPNNWLAWVLLALTVAGFTGWITAEQDNQILRNRHQPIQHVEVCNAD